MNIDERKTVNTGVIQNLILENRGKLSISGVLDVLSFDDQVVIVETELGLLTIKGENLRINKYYIQIFIFNFLAFISAKYNITELYRKE